MPEPTERPDPTKVSVTQILQQVSAGDDSSLEQLLDVVYHDLRAISAKQLSRERPDHTLQPTALVHEAYLRLVRQREQTWQNRAHFFSIASRIIRRVLVDHARAKQALKRDQEGADLPRRTLFYTRGGELDLLDLDEALRKLAEREPEIARVVEMRYFGELSSEEIAEALGVTDRTVRRHWTYAKAWLFRELEKGT